MSLKQSVRNRVWRKTVVLLTTATFAVIPVTPALAASGQFDPTTEQAIESIAQGTLAAGVPGLAIGIWVPGRGTFVRAFGTANLAAGAPFRVGDLCPACQKPRAGRSSPGARAIRSRP